MKLLCLSTAEQGCSLAIVDGDQIVCEEFWSSKLTHSRRLLPMIENLVENRAGMVLNEIEGFVAARGPGSFTGLRIGISVIKGLAYAMKKPAAGVSSLDGIAFRLSHASVPVCAMMDARRNEVYCAVYQFDHGCLVSKTREQVLCPEDAVAMTCGPTIFSGSGSKAYARIIEQHAKTPDITHPFWDAVSATALVRSLYSTAGCFDDPQNSLDPVYIRKSDAQLQFDTKQGC